MEAKVYAKICAIQAEMAATGIAKDRRNTQQGYQFRGIDDVYNAIAPVLAKHGLCILPRYLSRTVTERESKAGGALFNVVLEAEFDVVAAEDGSHHTIRTYGEAMDSADKATNKAMSAAYKYAIIQTFAIPTEGDNDADASSHEVRPSPPVQQQRTEVSEEAERATILMLEHLEGIKEIPHLENWRGKHRDEVNALPATCRKRIAAVYEKRMAELKAEYAKIMDEQRHGPEGAV